MLFLILQKMCAIEEELETKLGVFRFKLNGMYHQEKMFRLCAKKGH